MSRSATPSRADEVRAVLTNYVSGMTAQSIVRAAIHQVGVAESTFERVGLDIEILNEMRRSIALYVADEAKKAACFERLTGLLPPRSSLRHLAGRHMAGHELSKAIDVVIQDENGIVDARTRARSFAADVGFRSTDQYKLATAVSELARNIFRYAEKGKISFGATAPRKGMFIIAKDEGPGILDVSKVLSETYRSTTGLGRGLQGCKKLMDEFNVETAPGRGTTVTLRKFL